MKQHSLVVVAAVALVLVLAVHFTVCMNHIE